MYFTFCKCSQKKEKVFTQKKITNFPRHSGFIREVSGMLQDEEKKGHDLCLFSTNQKIALSSAENRAFSRTCTLRGQGLQNVFSRTPPLIVYTITLHYSSIAFHNFRQKTILLDKQLNIDWKHGVNVIITSLRCYSIKVNLQWCILHYKFQLKKFIVYGMKFL